MYPGDVWCGMKCISENQSCIFENACGNRKKYLRVFKRKQCSSIHRYVKYCGEDASEENDGFIPYKDILALSKLYLQTGFHCHYCGTKMSIGIFAARNGCTLDHRISLSKGGTNNLSNLVLCCLECNNMKEHREQVIKFDTENDSGQPNYVSIAAALAANITRDTEGSPVCRAYTAVSPAEIVRGEACCNGDEF